MLTMGVGCAQDCRNAFRLNPAPSHFDRYDNGDNDDDDDGGRDDVVDGNISENTLYNEPHHG